MKQKENILLVLMPFWTPLLPPLGIACLEGFLNHHGYPVKAVDANTDPHLRECFDQYFDTLRDNVPKNRQGNFYSMGHEVLRNHLMAHLNYHDEKEYIELVKELVYKTYYTFLQDAQVAGLNKIMTDFYQRVQRWFISLLEQERPDVLGFSLFNGTLPVSMWAAEVTKVKFPGTRVVMGGGVFCDQLETGTPNMNAFLKKSGDFIDKIIIGEGEILFLKYLRGELPQSQKIVTLKDLHWKTMDLSTAVLPDFSDFHLPAYPNLGTYTSRSCPFQCSFCSETLQWGKFRKKNAVQVVEEFKALYQKYRCQLYFLSDSLINPLVTDLAEACIKAGISIYWDGCIRVDDNTSDARKALLWRRGGFYRARLGVESGSQRMLDLMDKKITTRQIKASLAALASAGIKTSTLWIIGHPGETEEDFQQTLDLIRECKDNIYDVEGTPFWYHLTGQSNSREWQGKKTSLLYPGKARQMLITQTWIIDGEPQREEVYRRMNRFTTHLEQLGIPNPYSFQDLYHADQRWKKLHKNAVPPLMELKESQHYIDENKRVKEMNTINRILQHDNNWGF